MEFNKKDIEITDSHIIGGKGIYVEKSNCTFFGLNQDTDDHIYYDKDKKEWFDSNDVKLQADSKIGEAVNNFITEVLMTNTLK